MLCERMIERLIHLYLFRYIYMHSNINSGNRANWTLIKEYFISIFLLWWQEYGSNAEKLSQKYGTIFWNNFLKNGFIHALLSNIILIWSLRNLRETKSLRTIQVFWVLFKVDDLFLILKFKSNNEP